MEPRTDQSTNVMKIKVKTLGNTVYNLEMKPDVSCCLHLNLLVLEMSNLPCTDHL